MKIMENAESGITDKIWTVPNLITVFRVTFIIPIVILFIKGSPVYYSAAFILVLVAYLTDSLDGFIARRTGQISKLGMIIDPISDKLISIAISLTLCILGKLPIYYFSIIAVRDILILIGGIYAYRKKHVITLPLVWGKINTFLLGTILALYPLQYSSIALNRPQLSRILTPIVLYGTIISSGLIVISFLIYMKSFLKHVLKRSAEE